MYKKIFLSVLAITAAVLSSTPQADRTIHKCKTSQGMVYQKSPCAEGDESLKFWMPPEETGKRPKNLSIEQGSGGHYFLDSEVNGKAVTFVIDTGATYVSLPQSFADQAKLDCGKTVTMQTANGLATGCATVIDSLTVGEFLIRKVDAVIIPNLQQPLLGMNVLQRFSISQEGRRMIISER